MLLITEQWSFYQQTNQSLDPLEVIISNPSPLQPIMTPNRQPQSFSLSTPMIDDDAYSFLQHTPQHSPATSQNDSPSPEQLTRSTVKQSEIVLLLEKATTQLIKLYLSLKLCDRTALSPLFRSLSSASFALVSHIQTLQVKLKSKRKEMIRWHRQNPNVDANNSPPHVRALKSEYDCLVAQIELLQCKQNILEHESVMVEDQINTFLKKAEMGSGQTASQTARPPEHASTPTSPPRNVSILTTPQTTKAPIASPPERKRTPPLPSFPLQTPQNSKARRPAQTVQVIRPQTALRSTNRAQLTTTSSAVNRSASTPKRSMYPPQRSWKENTIEVDSPTRITCFTTMPRNRVADEMKTPLRARTAEDPDVNVTPKTQLQQRRAHLKQLEKPKTEMSMRILQEKFESIEVELYTQKPQGTNRPARRQAMEKGGLN
ncbi:hypothetical protein BLNAU_16613 [Blattamonas nauphoetae]|uniref:Uncharacterized protein n=1 Tax=Blattamonas nauphoetae TaxID=2049346 RepID=A0ABQ9X8A5_9EUKA|nr:hypothetical protein BLNAU_16613 [Blattamonas nauphoetae]